ncbi:MAG: 4'-phosphopantetheinyl transferase family protein [Hyphomicrobiaceae bacterium]
MDALIPPHLLDPEERPELAAGRPQIWLCQSGDRPIREVARAHLRALLGAYLGMRPDRVPLHLAPGQAPRVDALWQGLSLSISLSYAGGAALIGLCPGARIGVDLTEIVPMPDRGRVARLYLGPDAALRLAKMNRSDSAKNFALAWAEMEARSKCLGLGLQEWTPTRQQRLYSARIRAVMFELPANRTGCALAAAAAIWVAESGGPRAA